MTTLVVLLGIILTIFYRQLQAVHYESLIGLARLRNSQDVLERLRAVTPQEPRVSRSRQEIRMARQAMATREWLRAYDQLQMAIDRSLTDRDQRTAAAAQLEQARCATMLNQPMRAETRYRDILRNPDAAISVIGLAQLEYGLLVLLQAVPAELSEVLAVREVPDTSPVFEAVTCLQGALSAEETAARARNVTPAYQNDTYLTAAVLALREGDRSQAAEYLKACITSSRPATEWPAPHARAIRGRLVE